MPSFVSAQYQKLSLEKIRQSLLKVQASLVKDIKNAKNLLIDLDGSSEIQQAT